MVTVINTEELRQGGKTPVFEGYQHGDVPVSFFLVDAPPGGGPRLHRHPYAEVFVVQEGCAVFTVGGETHEVTGSHVVIVPPGLPHKFVNSGDGPLRMVNMHPTGQIVTEWLEG